MATVPLEAEFRSTAMAVDAPVYGNLKRRSKLAHTLFLCAVLFLLLPGLVHAYLLMPFPGSQNLEAISVSYYLEKFITPLRIAGIALLAVYAFYFYAETRLRKIINLAVLLFCGVVYYVTDVKYSAAAMFKEPKQPRFANVFKNKVPQNYLVVGIVHNGVAKAYPIVYLGYHHKIQDDVNQLPVLVTYCTMCRTGRVFSPMLDGKRESFRLVGARHFNAVIEDESSGSWWYQATGEAAVGAKKGSKLTEIPYEQATLAAWLKKYPGSLILQPEGLFKSEYNELDKYDVTQPIDRDTTIENKDTLLRKSWIVGIDINGQAKAYDWRQLVRAKLFNDVVGKTPLLVTINNDSQSFSAWNTNVAGKMLHFKDAGGNQLKDMETNSLWNNSGLCIAGVNQGKQLAALQAYQEYWHSWKNFHPNTTYTAKFL